MRIDLTGAASVAGYESNSGAAAAKPSVGRYGNGVGSVPEDKASISAQTLSVPSLASQALATAEARVAKVEALRQAVSSAAYNVDPALIAAAIISEGA